MTKIFSISFVIPHFETFTPQPLVAILRIISIDIEILKMSRDQIQLRKYGKVTLCFRLRRDAWACVAQTAARGPRRCGVATTTASPCATRVACILSCTG